ncbi:ArnT family glycosyltransferase [Paracoccus sp. P2]|uniref:ArnT family glycosyltransferase n=1 Tax=Paracoccus sp. P2 TaxID=3248840 RepID=UPI00391F4981
MVQLDHPGASETALDRWRQAALAGIAVLTLWRVAILWFNRTELWVDEAQYWLWGQSFSFGAYSKPPLIGWLIGLVTRIAGDSTFGVRLAAPLFHGITAYVVLILASRLADRRAAALAALTYATMPAATLGSLLISTDTPMLLAIAVALLLQHRLAERSAAGQATLLGLAVGLGFLSKHAMIFTVAGMVAAAVASPSWRLARRDFLLALLVALAVAAPNLWWIATHGFVTLRHLAEAGGAGGWGLHPARALRFLAEQFAVMGPLAFAAFLLSFRGADPQMRGLRAMAAVVLAIVTCQALAGRALANWAVGFTVASSIIAAVWLIRHPRLAMVSLTLGLVVAIALPLLTVFGTGWRTGEGKLILARHLGRGEVSARAMDYARRQGVQVIAAHDRGLLAYLSWQARATDLRIVAAPHKGAARHHWDLVQPFASDASGPAALLLLQAQPPGCALGPNESWIAGPGFAEGQRITLTLTSPACLMEITRE